MTSETSIFVLTVALVLIIFFIFVAWLVILLKRPIHTDHTEDWYNHKFRQLVLTFFSGLTIFSIVTSLLALLPRYDYDKVYSSIEQLEKMQKDIHLRHAKLEEVVYDLFNNVLSQKIEKGVSDALKKSGEERENLRKAIIQNQKNIDFLKNELLMSGKTDAEKVQIEKQIPKVNVPKVNIPKVNIPKVNIPKVNIPKVNVPNANSHK